MSFVNIDVSREEVKAINKENISAFETFSSIIALLKERKMTVSCAESCTGGLFGKTITDVPGASAVFEGGMITYTNKMKERLGVDPYIIYKHHEVSFDTAAHMAMAARDRFETDYAISTTGFAGPDGGNENDIVGTVYVGFATPEGCISCRLYFGSLLSREEIRERCVLFAAKTLLELLEYSSDIDFFVHIDK